MRSNFYEKRTARLVRLHALVAKRLHESESAYSASSRLGEMIPLGQPILVGHHSEGRHRRHLARINALMQKSVEAAQAARHHESSIAAMESNRSISSDDPEAIEKLRARIAELEDRQRAMVQVNKAVRKNDMRALEAMGYNPAQCTAFFTPDFLGRTGFADYQLSNNSGNLRRLKQRLAQLESRTQATDEEVSIGDMRVVNSATDNRTQIHFPYKPAEGVRTALKALGFRWCPTAGAWQRHLSHHAWFIAKQFVEDLNTKSLPA